ncbi:MBL fold metallo-hydrolase [Bhargavaea cecembensis]|uniref:MBL fold metallo-hydrolase n=1 Tax=Bhargavaea cecembensis TaxID=394098 RepID=A0A163F2A5_9BACL|nr:MBL fold metallo-hydrolase [Bhargavaea cecembensis]KZE37781.1 MBL fold metallo-hydrolase [Bhargavaea cecembensis]
MLRSYEHDGVTCLELTHPVMGKVFSFLTDGMLVDTGPQSLEADIMPDLEQASFDQVVLTHSHEDHSGNVPSILKRREVPVFVHHNGIAICAKDTPYPAYRQAIWGKRRPFIALPISETIRSRTREWTVIETPGHAEDHISLFDPQTGILFSGDLFVSPKTKVIMGDESIPERMASTRRLLELDFGPMFCCHAGYIPDGKNMLQQKLDHLEYIYGEVEALHKKGLPAEDIRKALYPKDYPIISVSGGEWDSLHIVNSVIADIEKITP